MLFKFHFAYREVTEQEAILHSYVPADFPKVPALKITSSSNSCWDLLKLWLMITSETKYVQSS